MTLAETTKLKVQAQEVQAGDWTMFNGYRLVVEVRKLTGRRVGLVRVNGKMDKMLRDRDVIVHREQDQIKREES